SPERAHEDEAREALGPRPQAPRNARRRPHRLPARQRRMRRARDGDRHPRFPPRHRRGNPPRAGHATRAFRGFEPPARRVRPMSPRALLVALALAGCGDDFTAENKPETSADASVDTLEAGAGAAGAAGAPDAAEAVEECPGAYCRGACGPSPSARLACYEGCVRVWEDAGQPA